MAEQKVTREELITALRHLHEMCRLWLQCSAVDNAEALLTRIDEDTDEEQEGTVDNG
jgi:hypothetical protein